MLPEWTLTAATPWPECAMSDCQADGIVETDWVCGCRRHFCLGHVDLAVRMQKVDQLGCTIHDDRETWITEIGWSTRK